jgi:hypothetical protein
MIVSVETSRRSASRIIIFPQWGNVRMRIGQQFGDVHEIIVAKGMAFLPLFAIPVHPGQGDVVHGTFVRLVPSDGGPDVTVPKLMNGSFAIRRLKLRS